MPKNKKLIYYKIFLIAHVLIHLNFKICLRNAIPYYVKHQTIYYLFISQSNYKQIMF